MPPLIPVLLIDDDRADYEELESHLSDFGIELHWASELDAAWPMLDRTAFSVVLVDRLFIRDGKAEPDRGLQIIRELKRRIPQQELILLTNHWTEGAARTAMQQDAYSAVRKGELELLLAEIRNAQLKRLLSDATLARSDLQNFITSSPLVELRAELQVQIEPAELLLELFVVVSIASRLKIRHEDCVAKLLKATRLVERLPCLQILNDEAWNELVYHADAATRTENRTAFLRIASAQTFALSVSELGLIELLRRGLGGGIDAAPTDVRKLELIAELLEADFGLTVASARIAVNALLGQNDVAGLPEVACSAFVAFRAKKLLDSAKSIVALLRGHVHIGRFSRELEVIECLLRAHERYSYLCEISQMPLDHRDWMVSIRDDLTPLMVDSRRLESHRIAFPQLAEPIKNCGILLHRFNRMFVDLLWDEEHGYRMWVARQADLHARPLMTSDVVPQIVVPAMNRFSKVLLIVFDGMSLLSWHRIRSRLVGPLFDVERDDVAVGMLPSATRFARSAIFAGRLPRAVVPADSGTNPDERRLLDRALRDAGAKVEVTKSDFTKYEERQDPIENEKRRQDLNRVLASRSRLSAIIFDPHDKVTHIAAGYAEDFAELFYEKTIHPVMERISKLQDTCIVIAVDHGFCEIRELRTVKGIFRIGNHRDSDFLYAAHEAERRGHFGKRYIDLGDRQFAPSPQTSWIKVIEQPIDWGLPDSNGFLIATGDWGFSLDEEKTRMFAHGGASIEEIAVPVVVLRTRH